MITPTKQKKIEIISYGRKNAVYFIEQILGCLTLILFQKNLIKTIQKHSRVVIRACHSVGKTFTLARMVLWFMFSFKDAVVITTAPTYRQVVLLLWGEIRKAKKSSKILLGGKLLSNKIEVDDQWYAVGFSPQDKAGEGDDQKGSTFQGFHARYIFICFDEACGISADMYKMAEGLQSSGIIVKWVCIGNPTSRATVFFRLFKKAEWKKVKIDCFDSPNMIANGFTDLDKVEHELFILSCMNDEARLKRIEGYLKVNPDMLTAQWAIAKFYDWGPDHPLTMSKVLAEFPDSDDFSIVSFGNVQKGINRELPEPKKMQGIRYIGVDPARFGKNKTVFTDLIGYKQVDKVTMNKADNVLVAGELTRHILTNVHHEVVVLIDSTGLGSGVIDTMRLNKREGKFKGLPKITLVEIHFNMNIELEDEEKQKQARKNYKDVKAFAFAKLNDDLKDNLDIFDEEVYEGQLPAIRMVPHPKGMVVIEDKDAYEERTGLKSPDESDSLALANVGRHLNLESGKFKKQQEKATISKSSERTKSHGKSRKLQKKMKVAEY
jgi:hypothetical protein